jgi:hypothetical protein
LSRRLDLMSDNSSLSGVLNAALEIAGKRRETLALLRAALEKGDDTEALKVARALCGVKDGQESHRADPRVN